MFLIDGKVYWSPTDLTLAAECEYGLLRTLDYRLGSAQPIAVPPDPLLEHISAVGNQHEAGIIAAFEAGAAAGGGRVVRQGRIAGSYSQRAVALAAGAAARALADPETAVLYQAAFLGEDFFGYADFVERTDQGWVLSDAKLARHSSPGALLQVAAYVPTLRGQNLECADHVSLLLGGGTREDFRVADLLPVYEERRDRLRALIAAHMAGGEPVQWEDDALAACGKCPECQAAAARTQDVLLVAGLRMDQRAKLRGVGIATIGELAAAAPEVRPQRMGRAPFEKLVAQARMQWEQLQGGPDAPLRYELTEGASSALGMLPAPSPGDIFFDFEGDPLYREGAQSGLEYLWGALSAGTYTALWAHDRDMERAALVTFLDRVAAVRARHPEMHIYHYAPYETAALKRLTARHQVREKELDDLLRSEVFVDLYAVVRGALRVSAPSYSIKYLEPLYMGEELRSGAEDAVAAGADSVVAYQFFRELRDQDPDAAEKRLAALAEYNEYDCLSTLRLRDWLLERATELGLPAPPLRQLDKQGEELSVADPLFVALMDRAGSNPAERTPEQQACALLATAIDYYRREHKQYWWEHFERLSHPVDDWQEARDLFVVDSVESESPWQDPTGRQRTASRELILTGTWTPGSKENGSAFAVFPNTNGQFENPEGAIYGVRGQSVYESIDSTTVRLTEKAHPDRKHTDLPVALTPGAPPDTNALAERIREVGQLATTAGELPAQAALDLLARRPPRLAGGGPLPTGGTVQKNVVAALRGMKNSYVAVQGPPGTGKTYTGARVIKELVERHGWRIGVVAQSHATVENLLAGVVSAGLSAGLVGKSKNSTASPSWVDVRDDVRSRAGFLKHHKGSGCVLGGTAWTFSSPNLTHYGTLDLLVIDEAGQFSLAPTIAVSRAAQRLLLLGDPQQLPQVSQGFHAEPVDASALGWLMDGAATLPPRYGYFLAESFRMHPDLCAQVSRHSYDSRLHSAPPARQRLLEGAPPGVSVVLVEHTGNRTESPEEAAAVVAEVAAHLGRRWTDPAQADSPRPLAQSDILVVAAFNAQVALLRKTLASAGYGGVRVGTVDKFQGQEAVVVIFSTAASSHGDVPRGMDFLLSRNRVNVSVSRAQWRAIIVRSQALTAYLPTSTKGLLDLGAFLALGRP